MNTHQALAAANEGEESVFLIRRQLILPLEWTFVLAHSVGEASAEHADVELVQILGEDVLLVFEGDFQVIRISEKFADYRRALLESVVGP